MSADVVCAGCAQPEVCQAVGKPSEAGREQCNSNVRDRSWDCLFAFGDDVHIGCARRALCPARVGRVTGGGLEKRISDVHRLSWERLSAPGDEEHIGCALPDH